MIRKLTFAALFLLLAAGATMAKDNYWLHVRVDEGSRDGEKIRINVPINLIETILPMIEDEDFNEGRIRIEDTELDAEDLRKIWEAVKASEDGEYITVENRHESVRVAKQDELIIIKVEEHHRRGSDDIDIQVPIAVVDALLSGDKDELDLVAGLQALQAEGNAIKVTVNDNENAVRVWVDESPEGDDVDEN